MIWNLSSQTDIFVQTQLMCTVYRCMEKYYKIRFPTETARCGAHIIMFFAFTQSLTNFTCGIAVDLTQKLKLREKKQNNTVV